MNADIFMYFHAYSTNSYRKFKKIRELVLTSLLLNTASNRLSVANRCPSEQEESTFCNIPEGLERKCSLNTTPELTRLQSIFKFTYMNLATHKQRYKCMPKRHVCHVTSLALILKYNLKYWYLRYAYCMELKLLSICAIISVSIVTSVPIGKRLQILHTGHYIM